MPSKAFQLEASQTFQVSVVIFCEAFNAASRKRGAGQGS